jgi:hypothetical protein
LEPPQNTPSTRDIQVAGQASETDREPAETTAGGIFKQIADTLPVFLLFADTSEQAWIQDFILLALSRMMNITNQQ